MPLSTLAPLDFVKPEIPTLVPKPPSGEGCIHEIKHDGYRTLIIIDARLWKRQPIGVCLKSVISALRRGWRPYRQ